MTPRNFIVITADIIGSRRFRDSEEFQKKTLAAVARINEENRELLVTRFSIMLGDEIQGVLQEARHIPAFLRHMRGSFLPLDLRVGVGVGEILTPIDPEDSGAMNGPAFHRARLCLESLERERIRRTMLISGDEPFDTTVNVILALIDVIQGRWTEAQWEAVEAYSRLGTYREAAERLGIALQNVEKRCRAASWPAVAMAEEELSRLLGERFGDEL